MQWNSHQTFFVLDNTEFSIKTAVLIVQNTQIQLNLFFIVYLAGKESTKKYELYLFNSYLASSNFMLTMFV